jgi:methylenetetrahydrofolate reductase (NADPH)
MTLAAPLERKTAVPTILLPRLGGIDGSDIRVSFEFFPPKSEKMEAQLWEALLRLAPVNPHFVSVTYGAGGSTRERTHATVERIQRETKLKAAAHFTCVAATREEIDAIARSYWESGIRHLVALRGDPPGGLQSNYEPTPGGYAYAADLVAGLKKIADFEISVSAYPEMHPQAPSAAADIDNLKRKIDAGATRAITQFFFSADCYFRFLDKVRAAGIQVPIVPGILPVSNFTRTQEFAKANGSAIPPWMVRQFEGLDAEPDIRQSIAAITAVELCRELYAGGVRDFHFYTLNRAELTLTICHMLGLRSHAAQTA